MPPFRPSFLALFFALVAVGCADSVEPTFDADKPYTLYGVLDPTVERQTLRVVPFEPDINPREPALVGAEVVSTNLMTGEQVVWTDSLVLFGDGRFGTIYHADFSPAYRDRYRIEARRADGAVSRAEVTVPPFVEALAQPSERPIGAFVVSALWPAAPRLNQAEAVFILADPDCNVLTQVVPVSRPAEPFEFGWKVPTDFLADARRVLDELAPSNNVALLDFRLRAVVSSEDWVPRGGTYDPEVLVDPNALTNVEDGFGFVGAGYVVDVSVTPAFDVVRQAGFRARGTCTGP
ncbi:MAG: hypothetical protein ABJF88_18495 [Rhodothermales bacterium]